MEKSQGDKLKLSLVAVLCVVSQFSGSLMFMQGIGEGWGNREYNREKWFGFLAEVIKKALPFLLL